MGCARMRRGGGCLWADSLEGITPQHKKVPQWEWLNDWRGHLCRAPQPTNLSPAIWVGRGLAAKPCSGLRRSLVHPAQGRKHQNTLSGAGAQSLSAELCAAVIKVRVAPDLQDGRTRRSARARATLKLPHEAAGALKASAAARPATDLTLLSQLGNLIVSQLHEQLGYSGH
jgi:hypothetical protein